MSIQWGSIGENIDRSHTIVDLVTDDAPAAQQI